MTIAQGALRCGVVLLVTLIASAGCGGGGYQVKKDGAVRLKEKKQVRVNDPLTVEVRVGSHPDFYSYMQRAGFTDTFIAAAARVSTRLDAVMTGGKLNRAALRTIHEQRWRERFEHQLVREAKRRNDEMFYAMMFARELRRALPNGRVYISLADDDSVVNAMRVSSATDRVPTRRTHAIGEGGYGRDGAAQMGMVEATLLGAGMPKPAPYEQATVVVDIASTPATSIPEGKRYTWGDRLVLSATAYDAQGAQIWSSDQLDKRKKKTSALTPQNIAKMTTPDDEGDAWWAMAWQGKLPDPSTYYANVALEPTVYAADYDYAPLYGTFHAQSKRGKKEDSDGYDGFRYVVRRMAHDVALAARSTTSQQQGQISKFISHLAPELANDPGTIAVLAGTATPVDARQRVILEGWKREKEFMDKLTNVLLTNHLHGQFGQIVCDTRAEERKMIRQYDSQQRTQAVVGTLGMVAQVAAGVGGVAAAQQGNTVSANQFQTLQLQAMQNNVRMAGEFAEANRAMISRSKEFAETMAAEIGPIELRIEQELYRITAGDLPKFRAIVKAIYNKKFRQAAPTQPPATPPTIAPAMPPRIGAAPAAPATAYPQAAAKTAGSTQTP